MSRSLASSISAERSSSAAAIASSARSFVAVSAVASVRDAAFAWAQMSDTEAAVVATATRVPIASGRACDVFAHGDGRVLRRYREGEPRDTAREAEMMRRAEQAGVPVPHVHEVHADALVMDRIDGPTMLEAVERRPWQFARHARDPGRLH